jgi:hypothetical protein
MQKKQNISAGDSGPLVHLRSSAFLAADFLDIRAGYGVDGLPMRASVHDNDFNSVRRIEGIKMFNSKIDDAGFIENGYDYGYLLVHSMGSDVFVSNSYLTCISSLAICTISLFDLQLYFMEKGLSVKWLP